MITDTCKCGAKFAVQAKEPYDDRRAHTIWLEAHAICRTASVNAEALSNIVAALYVGDPSGIKNALWGVLRALDPIAAELLGEDERVAYERYCSK